MAEGVPRGIRRFVIVFLAAFLVSGTFGIEAWPLTGWRLFSHLRAPRQVSWQAVAVDVHGREERVVFIHLPWAYRGFTLVMQRFDRLTPDRRRDVCRSWLEAVQRTTRDRVAAVRLFRVDRELGLGGGAAGGTPLRTMIFSCTRRGEMVTT
jgi:hypothetical protein